MLNLMFDSNVWISEGMLRIPQNFNVDKARKLQLSLAEKVLLQEINLEKVRFVGGVDVSYKEERAIASVAVLDYKTLKIVEAKTLKTEVHFPYVPSLLSFREAQPILRVFKNLNFPPDVLMVEGHGIAHPYGCGLASHIGVVLKLPTIGVAKKLLCGEVGGYVGNYAPVIFQGKIVGVAVITKQKSKPIYVSVGNMITLNQATEIVSKCVKNNRLPEPLRIVHLLTKIK